MNCRYRKDNVCGLSDGVCPWVYFCHKAQLWKCIKNAPEKCQVAIDAEAPVGQYHVREERKGYLYVDIDNCTYKIQNPFDYVPLYVKAYKTKTGWKIKKK